MRDGDTITEKSVGYLFATQHAFAIAWIDLIGFNQKVYNVTDGVSFVVSHCANFNQMRIQDIHGFSSLVICVMLCRAES
jgi:hypothetical protein